MRCLEIGIKDCFGIIVHSFQINLKAMLHRNRVHSESLGLTSRQIPAWTFLQQHFPSASLVVIFLNDSAYFSSFRMRIFMHACVLSHSIFYLINKYLWNTSFFFFYSLYQIFWKEMFCMSNYDSLNFSCILIAFNDHRNLSRQCLF